MDAAMEGRYIRTLAAAHAETGDFGKAVEVTRVASRLAIAQGEGELAKDLEQELPFYTAGLPYREPSK